MSEYRFPKTMRDTLRWWGFWEDGKVAAYPQAEHPEAGVLITSKPIPRKACEYLEAGVHILCVLDPKEEAAWFYRAGEAIRSLKRDEDLAFPDVLPDFSVRVGEFFE